MAEYRDGQLGFINPYNFVPLQETCLQNIDAEKNNSKAHSGFLKCEMETYTPLAIPDTADRTEDAQVSKHYNYPFLSINDKPVVPGSSIRGVIRSAYETLTNSCLSTVNPNEHITKRSDLGTFSPCVLRRIGKNENASWILNKAKRIPLVADEKSTPEYRWIRGDGYTKFKIGIDENEVKYLLTKKGEKVYWGDPVSIKDRGPGHRKRMRNGSEREVWNNRSISEISKTDTSTSKDAFLYLGEVIENKHAESVFVETGESIDDGEKKIVSNALSMLEDTLRMYRSDAINKKIGKNHYGYRGFEKAKKKGFIPLWYKEENGRLYLSLAAIGRISYYTPMGGLINGHVSCRDRRNLCPACALFGMVGKGKTGDGINKGCGSRVRITDAFISGTEDMTIKGVTLKELGAPRTSYVQFYSKDKKKYDEDGACIRGRKYYWHIPEACNDASVYSDKKNGRNGTFDLVKPGARFEFYVYYDGIDAEQLDMLKYVLTLEGNDSDYMHKIGHGKPLGLGSVKIRIMEQCERKVENGYCIEKTDAKDLNIKAPELLDASSWNSFKYIAMFSKESKDKITYPYVEMGNGCAELIKKKEAEDKTLKENVLASHQWFSRNDNVLSDIEKARERKLKVKQCFNLNEEKDFERKKDAKGSKDAKGNKSFNKKNFEPEPNKDYHVKVSGYETGREGELFYVRVEFDDGSTIKIPFYNLDRSAKQATDIKENTEFIIMYADRNKNGYPNWRRGGR